MAESKKTESKSTSSAGVTGTKESGLSGDLPPGLELPSETTPTAAEYRKVEEQLQADDDARREKAGDFEVRALAERNQHWTETAGRVKRPDEFLPDDKRKVFLPEGHPHRDDEVAHEGPGASNEK